MVRRYIISVARKAAPVQKKAAWPAAAAALIPPTRGRAIVGFEGSKRLRPVGRPSAENSRWAGAKGAIFVVFLGKEKVAYMQLWHVSLRLKSLLMSAIHFRGIILSLLRNLGVHDMDLRFWIST